MQDVLIPEENADDVQDASEESEAVLAEASLSVSRKSRKHTTHPKKVMLKT